VRRLDVDEHADIALAAHLPADAHFDLRAQEPARAVRHGVLQDRGQEARFGCDDLAAFLGRVEKDGIADHARQRANEVDRVCRLADDLPDRHHVLSA
jgi:hypothetical protein